MSFFDTLADFGASLFGFGGGDDNEAVATATTDVEVNPEITAVNVIDTEALGKALASGLVVGAALEAEAADRRAESFGNEVIDLAKLAGAGAVLAFALKGKFG